MSSSNVGSAYHAEGSGYGVQANDGAVRAPEGRPVRSSIGAPIGGGFLVATAVSLIGAAGSGIGVLATKPKLFSSQRAGGYCSTVMVLCIVAAGGCALGFLVCQIVGNIYSRRAQQLVPPQLPLIANEQLNPEHPPQIAQPLPQQAPQGANDEASQEPSNEDKLRGQVVAYDAALTALRQKVQKAQKFAETLA